MVIYNELLKFVIIYTVYVIPLGMWTNMLRQHTFYFFRNIKLYFTLSIYFFPYLLQLSCFFVCFPRTTYYDLISPYVLHVCTNLLSWGVGQARWFYIDFTICWWWSFNHKLCLLRVCELYTLKIKYFIFKEWRRDLVRCCHVRTYIMSITVYVCVYVRVSKLIGKEKS